MTLPLWGQYLLQGIGIFATIAVCAVTISRAGRNPYLAFLMLIPFVQIAAIWAFAFTDWPKRQEK